MAFLSYRLLVLCSHFVIKKLRTLPTKQTPRPQIQNAQQTLYQTRLYKQCKEAKKRIPTPPQVQWSFVLINTNTRQRERERERGNSGSVRCGEEKWESEFHTFMAKGGGKSGLLASSATPHLIHRHQCARTRNFNTKHTLWFITALFDIFLLFFYLWLLTMSSQFPTINQTSLPQLGKYNRQ